jgi:hypothetical protein
VAEFFHRVAIWVLFDPEPHSYLLRILQSGPSNVERVQSWVPMWDSKQWSEEVKNHGAPESEYDILTKGTSMGKTYHPSSMGICGRRSEKYKKKWGIPKSFFETDVRCTGIKIHNALALGRVITTLEVPSLQGKKDTDELREAIFEVEERILAALRTEDIPHADAKTHIRRFRDHVRLNFWDVDTRKDSCLSEHSAALEDFLQRERQSRKGKKSTTRPQRFSSSSRPQRSESLFDCETKQLLRAYQRYCCWIKYRGARV